MILLDSFKEQAQTALPLFYAAISFTLFKFRCLLTSFFKTGLVLMVDILAGRSS